jgi:hypothetical protein
MGDEVDYLYAFTWSDCPVDGLGPAVDPRFCVELATSGRLAALVSRVGLDQFDLGRLAGQNAADVEWLGQVAFRHNQIISQAASKRPVLPLRIGALFRSRASLAARLERCRPVVKDFLTRLGDRQEWAAKIYLDLFREGEAPAEPRGRSVIPSSGTARQEPRPPGMTQGYSVAPAAAVSGKSYLLRKRQDEQARRTAHECGQREAAAIEAALAGQADLACRVRLLPASLTGRREKMLLNAAYLVSRSASEPWLKLAERLGRAAAEKGLLLEVTGPWPPYHFCPEVNS